MHLAERSFIRSHPQPPPPNDEVQQRGRLERLASPESRRAGPVCCHVLLGASELRLQDRSFARRQPKEQFVLIQVEYYQCWVAPLEHGGLDALFLDMPAKCGHLLIFEADEQ